MSYNKNELLKLPVEEKLELVEALWESIEDDNISLKLSKDQIDELDRRIARVEENPDTLISWEDVKNKMKN